ncbi:MAG: hypothetical protein HZB10_03600 [Candidatus Yonathbacteria bacterium]|nr:hypothetical protein [Candidatus Yonathbacteria bacterium]
MKIGKKEFAILAVIVVATLLFFVSKKVNYSDEIAKQDLVLKCEQVYGIKHNELEGTRYKGQVRDALIWSPKTKTCLAYYNVNQGDYLNFLFEVWDYTNTDLVLSYSSLGRSEECLENGIKTDKQNFVYKYNNNLEGAGCGFPMRKSGTDLLTNFETAMIELGFRK